MKLVSCPCDYWKLFSFTALRKVILCYIHSSSFVTNLGGWFHLLFCCSLNLGWFHILNIMDNRISIEAIVRHIFKNLYIMDVNCLCFIMITNWYSNLISLFIYLFIFQVINNFLDIDKVELKSMIASPSTYFYWGNLISRLSIQCSLFKKKIIFKE